MFFKVFSQLLDQSDCIGAEKIVGFDEDIDKILIAKGISEFIKEKLGEVAFEKQRFIGGVHLESAHIVEGKDGQDKYQEKQKPSKTQDAFCQMGKKGVGAAELL